MTGLDRTGAVFVLTLGDDENRFHPASSHSTRRHLSQP